MKAYGLLTYAFLQGQLPALALLALAQGSIAVVFATTCATCFIEGHERAVTGPACLTVARVNTTVELVLGVAILQFSHTAEYKSRVKCQPCLQQEAV